VNQAARDRRPIAQSKNEALQVRNHGPGFTLVFYLLEDLAGFGCQRRDLLDAAFSCAPCWRYGALAKQRHRHQSRNV
jgi:hypothetical protein